MEGTLITSIHPLVCTGFMLGIVVLTMFSISPVLAAISFVSAFLFSTLSLGIRTALSKLRWQLPLLLLICVINPLFSAMGSTLITRIGPFRVYAESLAYGAVMGALLLSVLMWIEALSYALGPDELLTLGAGMFPRITLALSMVLRLVPQLVRRGALVRSAYLANVGKGLASGVHLGARIMSSLLSWSLEDSIERADSMRARGWGACKARSAYTVRPLRPHDAFLLTISMLLFCAAAWGVYVVQTNWSFYPHMEGSASLIFYIPFTLLCLLPTFALVWSKNMWKEA